jgi:tRNA threonylcarbamoyladenosine biosynthesis protein TsaB
MLPSSSISVLALDTSTRVQSVAAGEPGVAMTQRDLEVQSGHSSSLLESVHEVLGEAGLLLRDIRLLVVGIGPGSFTGLRIGMAAIKGLAYATGKPIVGVSSLMALAHGAAGFPDAVATATDARKGEVFGAVWERQQGGAPVALLPEAAFKPMAFARACAALGRPLVGVGNGFAIYPDDLHNAEMHVLEPAFGWPRASMLAELGVMQFGERGATPIEQLEPRYLRLSEAEINWPKAAQHGS